MCKQRAHITSTKREVPYGWGRPVHDDPLHGPGSFRVLNILSCYLSLIMKHYDTKMGSKTQTLMDFFGGGGGVERPGSATAINGLKFVFCTAIRHARVTIFFCSVPRQMYLAMYVIGWMSIYESAFSSLLVAVYQFVSIRLDPFGTRHIITTPRCVVACLVSWILSGVLSVLNLFIYVICCVVFGSVLIITCTSYILIYRAVSKVPCADNVQMRQRKAENKRLLRTFGLILGTSMACWLLVMAYVIGIAFGYRNSCFSFGVEFSIAINWCWNSLIYWWRLEEFRSVVCRKRRVGPVNIVV